MIVTFDGMRAVAVIYLGKGHLPTAVADKCVKPTNGLHDQQRHEAEQG